jgi:hypothetical protein
MGSRLHTVARHAAVLALLPFSLWMAPAKAQDVEAMEDARLTPLRLVEHVSVLVEDLTPDAERAAVTREAIAAEAAARLRVARLDVQRQETLPPFLYIQVSVLCNTGSVCAVDVSSAVVQDVYLLQGAGRTSRARTWSTGRLLIAPRALVAARVRDVVREQTDLFAADVLTARQRFGAGASSSASR